MVGGDVTGCGLGHIGGAVCMLEVLVTGTATVTLAPFGLHSPRHHNFIFMVNDSGERRVLLPRGVRTRVRTMGLYVALSSVLIMRSVHSSSILWLVRRCWRSRTLSSGF